MLPDFTSSTDIYDFSEMYFEHQSKMYGLMKSKITSIGKIDNQEKRKRVALLYLEYIISKKISNKKLINDLVESRLKMDDMKLFTKTIDFIYVILEVNRKLNVLVELVSNIF